MLLDMMDTLIDASLSRDFGGKDHHAWSFGVGNNL